MSQTEDHITELSMQLTKLQSLVRNLLGSLPIGIAIVDADGLLEGANPAMVSMFGYDEHELRTLKIDALLRKSPWTVSTLGQWYAENTSHVVELEGVAKDAEIVLIELTVSKLDDDVTGRFVISFQDVSERFLANKLKQDFFQMITHDIRSPITNVLLFLELLDTDDLGSVIANLERARVAETKTNVQRILNMASGLLEIDKLESGVGNLRQDLIEIRSFVENCVSTMKLAAAAKGISMETGLAEAEVLGDAARLEQVLVNLLSNAIAHSVANQPIQILAQVVASSVRISVRDHGSGVSEADRKTIFEKFKQGSSPIGKGFGLGLAICKKIVQMHGGNIGCENAPGGGSIFWFELPVTSS